MRTLRTTMVMVGIVALAVTTITAHMKLSKSVPEAGSTLSQAPQHIQIWFSQPPDPAVSQITVEGPSGEVELEELMFHDDNSLMAMPKTAFGSGSYTVRWRSAGNDGHVQRGDFSFSVQAD